MVIDNHCGVAVLGRAEEESVGIEELDLLQTELETLLACIAKRMRLLEQETQVLINWQDKGKDKNKAGKVVSILGLDSD